MANDATVHTGTSTRITNHTTTIYGDIIALQALVRIATTVLVRVRVSQRGMKGAAAADEPLIRTSQTRMITSTSILVLVLVCVAGAGTQKIGGATRS
eukprot:scaffold516574_cov17-Prasinocladus_malaysianus.AAC.1